MSEHAAAPAAKSAVTFRCKHIYDRSYATILKNRTPKEKLERSRRNARTALGAQIISLNAPTFRGPPPSAAQQSAAAIIATSFILSQCAQPRTESRESRCGCGTAAAVAVAVAVVAVPLLAKTNLPDTESSSPGRQKATGAGPACIPQLHEAEERSHLAPQPERVEPRGLPGDSLHP
ncbi:hypothetical protein G5I_05290 [Acromyrmex echinatior]|uniref:Uncharacterized protein n=1 Tax=Acromyrmex echinatior TaxID=103372 RepID=F4WI21_ACREC|nr:hypothetical protein G5I_05290 [Acromyrmex echinatior]